MPLASPVNDLLRHFHAQKPARVWSLIVTLYGDAIVPRGGSLWIGSLVGMMDLFRIDAGHVRTAVSRLSSDGWLSRVKSGRASHYRLSKSGEGAFLAATRRIYFGDALPFDGRVRVILLSNDMADAASARRLLADAQFRPLSAGAFLGLAEPPEKVSRRAGLHVLRLAPDDALRGAIAAAWSLDAIAVSYRAFITRFGPLRAEAARAAWLDADAFVARTLMIHAFRRIVLRDPALPDVLLPPDWPGREARVLAGRLYRQFATASERYLSVHGRNESGDLPAPAGDFASRFPK